MKGQESKTKSWISFRVKPKEYEQIHSHFLTTTCGKLSEYAPNILLQKPVNIRYRNQSADDFLAEMILLKNELNAFGNNFNQVVKRLPTIDSIPEIRTIPLTIKPALHLLMKRFEQNREWINKSICYGRQNIQSP